MQRHTDKIIESIQFALDPIPISMSESKMHANQYNKEQKKKKQKQNNREKKKNQKGSKPTTENIDSKKR